MDVDDFVVHAFQDVEILDSLHDNGSLEGEDHEEGEDGVLPIGVQAPQNDTEELEDGEGRDELLFVQVHEGG